MSRRAKGEKAHGRPAPDQENPCAGSTVPDRLAPMLAEAAEAPFDSDQHLFEVKWDGTRCIAVIKNDRLRLQNRRFVEILERYPELASLGKVPTETILDGEIVVLDGGKPSFNKLQQREHVVDATRVSILSQRLPVTFIAFDIPWYKGNCLGNEPLIHRRDTLRHVIEELGDPHVVLSEAVLHDGINFFNAVAEMGLEGVMAKRLEGRYQPGQRSTHWLKIKVARTAEYEIVGYVQREGEKTASALLLCEWEGERLIFRGKVGTGFTEAQRREFFERLVDAPKLARAPKDGPKEGVWRSCGLRCRIRFFEITADGHLRSPVFLELLK
jgi:DNA ligase D-like protein (predicted ligase)